MTTHDDEDQMPEVVQRLETAFLDFTATQQQRLLVSAYLDGKEAEIDSPKTTARTELLQRYQHLDSGKLEEILSLVDDAGFTRDDFLGGGDDVQDRWESLAHDANELLDEGYGAICVSVALQHVISSAFDRISNMGSLRASIFTGLVADFETFISRILKVLAEGDPRRLTAGERTVEWKEVFEARDLNELQGELVERAVVDVMRGSISDWVDALRKFAPDIKDVDETVIEVFQRRHAVVHNGGQASYLYLMNCPRVDVRRGDHLPVDGEYFAAAANKLCALALEFTVRTMLKARGVERSGVEAMVANWLYELLVARRFEVVQIYTDDLPLDRMDDHMAREICRVNRWIAARRTGKFDLHRRDVEAWQVGHLERRFTLAKLALLEKNEEAAALALEMVDDGTLPVRHWLEWPLLEQVRVFQATRTTPGDPGTE